MKSVTRDLVLDSNSHKSNGNDVLTGRMNIKDFAAFLKVAIPNFYGYTSGKRVPVSESLATLHQLCFMPGKPPANNTKIEDVDDYLYSLMLAVQAHKVRLEEMYTEVEI